MKKRTFVPLEEVSKPILTTDEAAYYLNRKPQTLRKWACEGTAALLPVNIEGRLAWKTTDIKKLLGL